MEARVGVVTLALYRSALVKVTDSSSFSASLQKRKLKTLELNANAQQTLPGENILLKWPDFPLKLLKFIQRKLKKHFQNKSKWRGGLFQKLPSTIKWNKSYLGGKCILSLGHLNLLTKIHWAKWYKLLHDVCWHLWGAGGVWNNWLFWNVHYIVKS